HSLRVVGDLPHPRQHPPGDRSALPAGLRDELDRRRATYGEESPSAVRGILGDLGTPDEVVTRAKDGDGGSGRSTPPAPAGRPTPTPNNPPAPAPTRPAARTRPPAQIPAPKRGAWWSGTGTPPPPDGKPAPAPASAPAPVPHPRGWWHGESAEPGGDLDPMVPGFVGGVEAPELFRPPEPEAPEEDEPEEAPAPAGRARRLARLLRRRRPGPEAAEEEPEEEAEAPARRGVAHPFLLLAALLLIAGAAFGWLLALAGGWLIAYGSRRLTPAQVKTAVLVLPGLAAAGSAAWLWGRRTGRWGDPLPPEALGAALADTWPWTLRAAAVLSALYLLRRARRG
ncbi:hypothetical protein, partial [Streptomyces sp. NPDC058955]|uniref:hypothetical protein n=1 Tax=Streptomyces sp. NPDC058955 TaxID=3346678 RepID=UPI0036974636